MREPKFNFNFGVNKNIMKTLLPMTDFVLEQYENNYSANTPTRILNYATFLKQPLKLEMFVPCDEDGNVLEEPKNDFRGYDDYSKRLNVFEKAEEKVLFEGFNVFNSATKNPDIINRNLGIIICFNSIISVMIEGANGYGGFSDSKILIEQLSQYNLELTPTALKQIGL